MRLGLFTDLYELTMARAYRELDLDGRSAVFSLFVRRLPPERSFLVACGLDDLLDALETLRFEPDDLAYLAAQGFPQTFLDWLAAFRFDGEIYAMAEGTPFFANEPILEIVAPIAQAQLLETLVLNQIGFQTLIASKAARIVGAAEGRQVIDFGGRRAHGIEAAVTGARAAFIAGVEATSNVLAGSTYGIPLAGTMAHSFIQAFPDEMEAFRAFVRLYPETTLLVDTYDTIKAVRKVIALSREMHGAFKIRAIRLDSGDLLELSRRARNLLDDAGLSHLKIVASGGLNEHVIEALVSQGAPIDSFGVGTDLLGSVDAPSLDIVYKLTEFDGEGRIKLSAGKRTLPGRKQVFRTFAEGQAYGDMIGRFDETLPGTPLLREVMRGGVRLAPREPLASIRARCRDAAARLPAALRVLAPASRPYPVDVSPALAALEQAVREGLSHRQKKA